MKSYNNITLVGRIQEDTKIEEIGSDKILQARMIIAIAREYPSENNLPEDFHPTDIFPVFAWGKLAKICEEYVKKDCLILISGRISSIDKETPIAIIADSVNVLEYKK